MDLLIRDARVADVEAGRLVPADVGVRGDTIELVAPGGTARTARRELRVDGLVIAPGFIDLHTHTDFTLPVHPRADAMVRQGVTLQVAGNCGFSPFPVAAGLRDFTAFLDGGLDWSWDGVYGYVRTLESRPLATNVALQVGHGAARIAAMGFDERAPSAAELAAIERHVADGFEHGAFGVSTGLIYAPGRFAATDELVAVAAVARRYGGCYSSHIRDEGTGLLPAVAEAIDVGRRAGVPVQLSHHKATGRANWGSVASSLRLIDEARREGLDVLADQYPYTAGSTTLASIVPGWASAGGIDGLRRRLADPAARAQIRAELLAGRFDPETIVIGAIRPDSREPDRSGGVGPDPRPAGDRRVRSGADIEGRRLADIALSRGEEPVDVALDLLREHGGGVQMIQFSMSEDDVATVLRHPCVASRATGGRWRRPPAGSRIRAATARTRACSVTTCGVGRSR